MIRAGGTYWIAASALRTVSVVICTLLCLTLMSINFDREQEAFVWGAAEATLGAGITYGLMVAWIGRVRRGRMTPADRWFIEYGGTGAILAALMGYFAAASVFAGRVM